MAAVAPPAEQAKDLLQNLSLDPKKKTNDSTEATKKSAASGGDAPNVPIPNDRSVTPLLQDFVDQSMWYPSMSYYYGGYEGAMNEWEDCSRYVNHDGVEMPSPGLYGDIYHHGYGYAPYGAYPSPGSPVPTIGHDGQLYGTHQYQYPSPYYQQPAPPAAQDTTTQKHSSRADVSTSAGSEQAPLPVDAAKASSNGVANGSINKKNSPAQKLNHNLSTVSSNGTYNKNALSSGLSSPAYADMRYNLDGLQSPVLWVGGSGFTDRLHPPGTNRTPSTGSYALSNISQNVRPVAHVMGLNAQRPSSAMGPVPPGYLNRLYPNGRMYGQYGNAIRNGFGLNGFDSRLNGRWGAGVDGKYKPRGRGNGFYGYGNESLDGLSELNRGPRSDRFKNQKGLVAAVTVAAKCEDLVANDKTKSDNSVMQEKDMYNLVDFPVQYADARFFVIKSYSEDDVHKSVKYGVWASTPNGNKKLDCSYQEAQGKEGGCPVFLFFSVNTSGQFVGVAEMVGPVDFNKTVEYWQQDKWNGCFPVKWHIVKDVPNSILKHIILENNDNKSVTNSRDTQEVKLEQGLQMLKIFKDHVSKTSILDDFGFYEMRQKVMQEKKAKQQHVQTQIPNGKFSDPSNEKDDNVLTAKSKLQSSLEVVTLLKKDVQGGLAERETTEENGAAAVTDVPKVAELPPNSANGC